MLDTSMEAARARVAAQQGELRGWRPLVHGDVAVVALQVLGTARGEEQTLGLRAVVAGRSDAAIASHGDAALESALRKRAVLVDDDQLVIVHRGEPHGGSPLLDDPLAWPWQAVVIHVPIRRLPAIAGLAADAVPTGQ